MNIYIHIENIHSQLTSVIEKLEQSSEQIEQDEYYYMRAQIEYAISNLFSVEEEIATRIANSSTPPENW